MMAQVENRHPARPTAGLGATAAANPAAQAAADGNGTAEPTQSATADNLAAASEAAQPSADPSALPWHDDYRLAMDAAVEQQRMMLIYFYDPQGQRPADRFRARIAGRSRHSRATDPRLRHLAKLPADAAITSGGKPLELLKHPAFAEMLGRAGMAILDFAHPQADYFGPVVSTFPFVSGKYYSRPVLATVLSLPAGTLTQRTMIYAVRVHPEAPASTQGQFNGVLADEAIASLAISSRDPGPRAPKLGFPGSSHQHPVAQSGVGRGSRGRKLAERKTWSTLASIASTVGGIRPATGKRSARGIGCLASTFSAAATASGMRPGSSSHR